MKAQVETTHGDGSPKTFRDEHGGLWRVVADAADGTRAVEQIAQVAGKGVVSYQTALPTVGELPVVGYRPCGIAEWSFSDGLEIFRAASHGEGTAPSVYDDTNTVWQATPNGWQPEENVE